MKLKYAVQEGWGYIVELHDDHGGVIVSHARGDCWSDLHKFSTKQMPKHALTQAALHLAELINEQYREKLTPILAPELLPKEYR